MKQCSKCKTKKPLTDFHKGKGKDGRAAWCKNCMSSVRMNHYYNNLEEERKKGNERNRNARLKNQERVREYLQTHPCVDCGETDYRVLEFDHVRGIKSDTIANMIGSKYRWEPIAKEIAKCDVRCANHHRIRHYEENGW